MYKHNILREKAMQFAVRVVNLYKYLNKEKHEFVIAKQILRSGTSIGANIAEAIRAESSADFIHKLSISRKEEQETMYWIELLYRTDYLSINEMESMQKDCSEIGRLLTSIIKRTNNNNPNIQSPLVRN